MPKRICCGLALLLFIGCGAGKRLVYSPVYSLDRDYVKLMKTVDEKTGEPLEASYEHPQQLAPERLKFWLEALHYEHYQWSTSGFDNRWVKDRVFEPQAIAKLVPQLIKAFSQATAADIILFSVGGRGGDSSGRMWLKGNQWVCELHQIDGYGYKGEAPSKMDNHDWRLVEAEGLKINEDWSQKSFVVAINLETEPGGIQQLPASGEKASSGVSHKPYPPSTSNSQLQTADQKLRLLKTWLDEGLITQKQYQEKVNSLLEGF